MRIKELHLRNIASIEEADIDFEKGLVDKVTGEPASMFLISGDTGAGKSVILDGICLALYKNTPRLYGVKNPKKNRYSNKEGESIQVNSVEQYTRLGIGPSDECYSEVVFEGNDGKEYRAKLVLGMTKSTKKDADGNSVVKYKSPSWTVKAGNAAESSDSVSETIYGVVGLTFVQFCRMAMLAQGQFAEFLTGEKKDREVILEQLTNTEHFSAYGKAISRLYSRSKEDLKLVKKEYDNEETHRIPDADMAVIKEKEKNRADEEKTLDGKILAVKGRIEQVKAIVKARAERNTAEAEKTTLEITVSGDDYKSRKALVSDWDATVTERQRLSDLLDARKKLEEARANERSQMETFGRLAADLEARRAELSSMGDPEKAVSEKQGEIDRLTEKRNTLNPVKVDQDLSDLSSKKAELAGISERAKGMETDSNAIETLNAEISKDEETLAKKKEAYDEALEAYKKAKAHADSVNAQLTTMSSSVEEAFVNIRRRLVEEHAKTCPLCGQEIREIPIEEEFRNILTPFQKTKDEADAALESAEKARDEAKQGHDALEGIITAKKGELGKKRTALENARKKLSEDASKFGIDILKPLAGQVSSAEKDLGKQEENLKAKQKRAAALLNEIEELRKAKNPLDEALTKYLSAKGILSTIGITRDSIMTNHEDWTPNAEAARVEVTDIVGEWNGLLSAVSGTDADIRTSVGTIRKCDEDLNPYYARSGKNESDLAAIAARSADIEEAREFVGKVDEGLKECSKTIRGAVETIREAKENLGVVDEKDIPEMEVLEDEATELEKRKAEVIREQGVIKEKLEADEKVQKNLKAIGKRLKAAEGSFNKWNVLNEFFGGTRFRTLVQTYILRPLLNNANIYLKKITDRYKLTCSEENEQLSILVMDTYNKDQIRSATVLSGGERFMISLALSLALSSLNRPDLNVNILFIDEGFGTLDQKSLGSVMETLEKLREIAGESERRVGIISHREELDSIPVQLCVKKKGEGRSVVVPVFKD